MLKYVWNNYNVGNVGEKVVLDHDEVSPDQVHKLLVVTVTLIFKVNGHFRLFSAILTTKSPQFEQCR